MRAHLKFIGLVIVMGLIGLGVARALDGVSDIRAQLEDSNDERASLAADLNDQEAASQALAEQVKRLGGKPVVDPVQAPQTSAVGPAGPAPTAAQIRAAVADYCTGDRCKPTVTRAQVATAVADYCAGGVCQGTPGEPGEPGEDGTGADGKDGAPGADGAPGPGPSPEQIAAAVETYCAEDRCQGEPGATGPQGPQGEPGRVPPGSWACPDGEWVSALDVAEDGSLAITCSPVIGRK